MVPKVLWSDFIKAKAPTGFPACPPGVTTKLVNAALYGLFISSSDWHAAGNTARALEEIEQFHYFLRVGLASDPEILAICGRLA